MKYLLPILCLFSFIFSQPDINGDINGDGSVDASDMILCSFDALNESYNELSDIDSNGIVDVLDVASIFVIWAYINYGVTPPASTATYIEITKENNSLYYNSNGFVFGLQIKLLHGEDIEFEYEDAQFEMIYDGQEFETNIILLHNQGISELILSANSSFIVDNIIAVDWNDYIPVIFSESIPGDINEDGVLDIIDIVGMVNYILNSEYNAIGDVNNDGSINIFDIILIVSWILG